MASSTLPPRSASAVPSFHALLEMYIAATQDNGQCFRKLLALLRDLHATCKDSRDQLAKTQIDLMVAHMDLKSAQSTVTRTESDLAIVQRNHESKDRLLHNTRHDFEAAIQGKIVAEEERDLLEQETNSFKNDRDIIKQDRDFLEGELFKSKQELEEERARSAKVTAAATHRINQHEISQRQKDKEAKAKIQHTAWELKQVTMAYENEKAERETLQNAYTTLKENPQSNNPVAPYVMVLIDGDGYKFRKDLLREGRPGGIQAAQNLRQAVEEAIQDLSLRVKVRVYLNSGGLAKYYRRIGSIYDEETLTEFNRGFTNVQPLFDVVDCGVGKEVADSKIRENFDIEIRNRDCRRVILGVCHDNGYARMIGQYGGGTAVSSKIVLLKGPLVGREYSNLNFKWFEFPSVFGE